MSNHKISELTKILMEAREKISKPENWTKDHFAMDVDGNPMLPYAHGKPVSFCIWGAIMAVTRDCISEPWDAPKTKAGKVGNYLKQFLPKYYDDIGSYNNNSTHEQVLNLLEEGIRHSQTENYLDYFQEKDHECV